MDTSSATAAVAAADTSLTSLFTGAGETAAPATTERGLAALPPLAAAVATSIVGAPAAVVAVAAPVAVVAVAAPVAAVAVAAPVAAVAVAAPAAAVAVAASAVAETLLLSSQAFLLLLARSFLLWLAGRLAPCFLEVAALAAPPLTLHEKLSSSSPPTVSIYKYTTGGNAFASQKGRAVFGQKRGVNL